MAIPKFLEDLLIISKLGDNPGADNGLSSSGLREKFDEAGVKIQKYINDTLIPALSGLSNPEEGLNMKNDIAMGGHRVTGLGEPKADGDAVPLGYANGHFAPAGYGYGDVQSCVFWSDSDGTQFENYIDTNILPKMPDNSVMQLTQCVDYPANKSSGNGGMAIVKKSSEGADALITFFGNGGLIAMKQKLTNVWYPWEYLNPRMQPGVEYRTTERYNGKVVYAMLLEFDNLSNGLYKVFTNAYYRGSVRVNACVDGYLAPFYSNGTLLFAASAEGSVDGVKVTLYSNGSFDGLSGTIALWYTKD